MTRRVLGALSAGCASAVWSSPSACRRSTVAGDAGGQPASNDSGSMSTATPSA